MSVDRCSQCHNTTFHFDRTRHAIVCDVCGWERNSTDRAGEMLTYDQHRQKAIAFVRAQDYVSAMPYLEKMRRMKPDDADIYYLHLMGLTQCCQDLLLEPSDAATYDKVRQYWHTFQSLQGDPSIFRPYFARRQREYEKRRKNHLAVATSLVAVCYLPLIALIAMIANEQYWALVPAVVLFAVIAAKRPLSHLVKLLF